MAEAKEKEKKLQLDQREKEMKHKQDLKNHVLKEVSAWNAQKADRGDSSRDITLTASPEMKNRQTSAISSNYLASQVAPNPRPAEVDKNFYSNRNANFL